MRRLRITFNSPVVLGFMLLSFGVLELSAFTNGMTDQLLFMTYRSPLTDPLTYIRFFTHVLGHSGWEHYISNASYLLLLGPLLEEKYGSAKIVEVIMTTALITGLINYFLFPGVALCGASGVVFAFILITSFTGFNEGEIPLTVILVAVIFIGQQVYEGIFLQDDVSNLSHIIGGLVGAVIGYNLNMKKKKKY